MTTTNYCKIKGPSYLEAAIWRFKEENRALMRRMYGDMESTSVYRQMRSSMSPEQEDLEFKNQERYQTDRQSVTLGSGFMPDLFSSLEYNIRMGSGLATVQSAKEPIVERIVENGMIKVKRKIVKKKKIESDNVKVETSTTSSTSSVFATTSEFPSPATTMVPNPTTTMNQPIMTTQPSLSQDTDVTVVDIDDTTTDLPMLEAMAMAKENLQDVLIEDPFEFIPDHSIEPDEEDVVSEEPIEYDEEIIETVDYSGESLNACPVTEEVFAPYWANNTRDQVLALLNLYPFEQYIHIETCKFEHEEMLCRKGCRCEQQYRLHRLLAFDPNNECRGIFSDWFRFPSYCICKCYNFPSDFLSKPEHEPPSKDDDEKIVFEDNDINKQQPETLPNPSPQLQVLSQQNKGRSLQNIPVHLPYEAKQALLRELQSRNQRNMDQPFFYSAPVMEYNLSNGEQGTVGQTPRK